jgi:hypothetical protein
MSGQSSCERDLKAIKLPMRQSYIATLPKASNEHVLCKTNPRYACQHPIDRACPGVNEPENPSAYGRDKSDKRRRSHEAPDL